MRFPSFTGAIRAPIGSLSAPLRRPASKTAGCGQRWRTKAFAIGIYAAATELLERTMTESTIAVRGGRCKFCKSASGLHAHLLSPGDRGAAVAARNRLGRGDHHQAVESRFRAPDFAGAAEHLAHVGPGAIGRHAVELFADRIEAHEGIGAPVGQPDLVLVVDPNRIGMRIPRQLPFAPAACGRIVHPDLTGVPVADPDPP